MFSRDICSYDKNHEILLHIIYIILNKNNGFRKQFDNILLETNVIFLMQFDGHGL